MKIISTCLLLLISGFAFSQFNRTFFHARASNDLACFSSYAITDSQNEVDLYSFSGRGFAEVNIVRQHISTHGDLETFDNFTYPVTITGNGNQYLLLSVIESGNERYFVLGLGYNNTTMKLIWLKTDQVTGNFISSLESTVIYKQEYFESKLIGNELVTYLVKDGGILVRVALNTSTFTAPTQESVSTLITTSPGYVNTAWYGYKSGELFEVNGTEKLVVGTGAPAAIIFTRTAANTYTSVTTGVATNHSISSFLINPTTIAVSNGSAIEHYNDAGTLVSNGTFTTPAAWTSTQMDYKDNTYHIYYKVNSSNQALFYRADQNFQPIDSLSNGMLIYHLKKTANGMLLVGSDATKGLSLNLSGYASSGRVAYCESYSEFPQLKREEYWTYIKSMQNLRTWTGMGTKVIANPSIVAGANYLGKSACYNLNDHFVGFIGNSDTVSNAASAFEKQFNELPGPYTTSSLYDEVEESKHNRPYHITRQMIEDHIDSVASGSASYLPVWQIRNWPAHGNTALGQAANLAPFADINSNGVYEPMQGEYPRIFGNDCVFSITHYRTNGDDSKALEFHSYVYTQSCDTTESFDDVLMRKVQIWSRGAVIDSLFYGGRMDGDLGNYLDDYAGTNVDLGMVYNYNADLMDESASGIIGFGDTLAAQGLMILKGFKLPNDGLDNGIGVGPGQSVNGYGFNDGVTDNEYSGLNAATVFSGINAPAEVQDPTNSEEWYNLLAGYFRFGDAIYYGGTGFQGSAGSTTILTKYMFPGSEDTHHYGTGGIDPGFEWSEIEPAGTGSSSNSGGDRRNGYSFGKTALNNGEFVELDYAYLIKRQDAPSTTITGPVDELFAKASAVRNAFMSNEGPCGINFDPIPVDLSVAESKADSDPYILYPNPTTGLVYINGISENGATVKVFDISGKLLQTVNNFQPMQTIDLGEVQGNIFIFRITDGSKSVQKRIAKQ